MTHSRRDLLLALAGLGAGATPWRLVRASGTGPPRAQ